MYNDLHDLLEMQNERNVAGRLPSLQRLLNQPNPLVVTPPAPTLGAQYFDPHSPHDPKAGLKLKSSRGFPIQARRPLPERYSQLAGVKVAIDEARVPSTGSRTLAILTKRSANHHEEGFRALAIESDEAPRPKKVGTIASPWRYDAATAQAIRPDNQRRAAILR